VNRGQRKRLRVATPILLIVVVATVLVATLRAHHASPRPKPVPPPTALPHLKAQRPRVVPVSRLLGQLIVGRFDGTRPSRRFMERVKSGHLGAVILFSENTAGGLASVRGFDQRLQRAARSGGNPRLLIMTDQEGGAVRRLAGAPALAPAEMSSASVARTQGLMTGRLLRSADIDVDLAPVADVESPRVPSFLGSRSFGTAPQMVAERACAFAQGLVTGRVAYTLKHFPGLGLASTSTDAAPVAVSEPASLLHEDDLPYRRCGSGPLALTMVDSASYPTLTGGLPAVVTAATYARELPNAVSGLIPVTISDNLEAPALADVRSPGLQAIRSGLDLAMYATSEHGSATAYKMLLAAFRRHRLGLARIEDAAVRVEQLKRQLGPQPR
jgi:beta-N-acetylhexosaminidase